MSEKQIIDFLIIQSEILGLPKENCPYYQIIEFIAKDKEKILKYEVGFYNLKNNLYKLIAKDKEKILKYEVGFYNLKNNLYKLIEEELPDDEICDCCSNYDVNGVRIKQKLLGLLNKGE